MVTVDEHHTLLFIDPSNINLAARFASKYLFGLQKISTFLNRLHKFTEIQTKVDPNFFSSYIRGRTLHWRLKKLLGSMALLRYFAGDEEIEMKKEHVETVIKLMNEATRVLSGESDVQTRTNAVRAVSEFVDSGHFARRDSFPTDYKLGIFLPLLGPVTFPIARALIEALLRKIRSGRPVKIKTD
eukprot:TRINITY_DN5849_c0_g1_i2.p1 TRINITY_DN5849_c0_g1~~TRINITY_DN5849_c0_g1_i2.p1  ORF type:complete len:185 (-),score=28.59 TRINITY_DN5849_c0_g1_i2:36-590(-)